MSASLDVEITVPGKDNPDRMYLTVLPQVEHGRVLVRRGPSGRHLPKCWAYWFRELVMQHKPSHTAVRITIAGDQVYLSCGNDIGKAITIATNAGRHLSKPGPNQLQLITDGFNSRRGHHLLWRVGDSYAPRRENIEPQLLAVRQNLSRLTMPTHARAYAFRDSCGNYDWQSIFVAINWSKRRPRQLGEYRMMLETQYLMCSSPLAELVANAA